MLISLLFLIYVPKLSEGRNKMVIIMLDGVRHDYIERMDEEDIPNLKRFVAMGTRAQHVETIFPSKSYPAWRSIVTGKYAEEHEIMGNSFLHVETGLEFSVWELGTNSSADTTLQPIWWEGHKPIWTTSTENGVRTSLYLWGRCDYPYGPNKIVPEKCEIMDNDRIYKASAFGENLMAGLEDLKNGFGLVMIYHDNVDAAGHSFGPDTQNVFDEMIAVDQKIGQFLNGLYVSGLDIKTNIFILSDHGMAGYEDKQFGVLGNYINKEDVEYYTSSAPAVFIKVSQNTDVDSVYNKLVKWSGMNVYKRENIPAHMHVKKSDNVLDILIVSKGTDVVYSSFSTTLMSASQKQLHRLVSRKTSGNVTGAGGTHGWDDTSPDGGYSGGPMPDMRTIFLARGPDINAYGKKANWIKLVDEYQLFCHLLHVPAEAHNGTWQRVQEFLREPAQYPSMGEMTKQKLSLRKSVGSTKDGNSKKTSANQGKKPRGNQINRPVGFNGWRLGKTVHRRLRHRKAPARKAARKRTKGTDIGAKKLKNELKSRGKDELRKRAGKVAKKKPYGKGRYTQAHPAFMDKDFPQSFA